MHKNICDLPFVSYANKKKYKQTFPEIHEYDMMLPSMKINVSTPI